LRYLLTTSKTCEQTVDILGAGAVHGVTLRPSNENAVQLLEVKHVAVPAVDLPLEFKARADDFTDIRGRVGREGPSHGHVVLKVELSLLEREH